MPHPVPLAAPASRPRILLVGAGHAHLHVLRHARRLTPAEVVVADPGGFWYSGMAAALLGAELPPQADRLDPRRLAQRHGARALRTRLCGLDLTRRVAHFSDGQRLNFSWLSLNLGSRVEPLPQADGGPRLWRVKPIPELLTLRQHLTRAVMRGERPHLAVVGGGFSGVELTCNLAALARRQAHPGISVTLVTRATRLLPQAPAGASHWVERHLARCGIRVLHATRALGTDAHGLRIATPADAASRTLPVSDVVQASGLAPPLVADQLGLPLIAGRGLAIRSTLQSIGDPRIFAVGDCAALPDRPLPRQGVYGVRQGPVLLDNLRAALHGAALRDFHPQRHALAILDLGQGMGLAIRGRYWWAGRLTLRVKRHLDRAFLARYRG